jgi:hypothetical protein
VLESAAVGVTEQGLVGATREHRASQETRCGSEATFENREEDKGDIGEGRENRGMTKHKYE